MRQDDWITKLYIMEQIKQTFTVPTKFGFIGLERDEKEFPNPHDRFEIDWYENTSNYTHNQIEQFTDVISSDVKEVDEVYDNDRFVNEMYYMRQFITLKQI
jgi:hypothetical protein